MLRVRRTSGPGCAPCHPLLHLGLVRCRAARSRGPRRIRTRQLGQRRPGQRRPGHRLSRRRRIRWLRGRRWERRAGVSCGLCCIPLDGARALSSAWQRVALWPPGSHNHGLPALIVAIPPKYPVAPATASVAGGGIELTGDEGAVPSVPLEAAVTRLHGASIASPQPTSITALCWAWRHAGTRRLRCTGTRQ